MMAAMLASPQQINLYNPALLPARQRFPVRQLVAWLVFAAAALGAIAWWAAGETRMLRREIAGNAARGGVPIEGPTPQQVGSLEQRLSNQRATLEARRAALDAMKRGMAGADGGPSGLMRRLANTIPPTMWLLDVNATGSRIDLQARALEPAAVEGWLERLRSEGFLAAQPAPSVRLDRVEAPVGGAPLPPAYGVQVTATLATPFAVEAGRP